MSDPVPYIEALQQIFRQRRQQYSLIKQQTVPEIVRWEWTDALRYDLRPYYFERLGQHRGEIATHMPGQRRFYHYGFDPENRVRVEEFYDQSKLVHEAFWLAAPEQIDIVYYENGQLIRVVRLDAPDGQPVQYRQYDRRHGVEGSEQELYTWANGQLVKIGWQMQRFDETVATEVFCFYDDDGELSRIEGSPLANGFVPQIYRRT